VWKQSLGVEILGAQRRILLCHRFLPFSRLISRARSERAVTSLRHPVLVNRGLPLFSERLEVTPSAGRSTTARFTLFTSGKKRLRVERLETMCEIKIWIRMICHPRSSPNFCDA